MNSKIGKQDNSEQQFDRINSSPREDKDFQKEIIDISNENSSNFDNDLESDDSVTFEKPKYLKMFHSFNEQEWCIQIIKDLTHDFKLSYTKIKGAQELENAPLKFLKKKDIIYLIRYCRQKQNRAAKQNQIKPLQYSEECILNKKRKKEYDSDYFEPVSTKRYQKDSNNTNFWQDRSLAMTLIQDFPNFDKETKTNILNKINDMIQSDKHLYQNVIQKQVKINIAKAKELYDQNKQKDLLKLLSGCSPLVAIYLNIELSLTNNQLTDESNTLSLTLLPYLNVWVDYSFIQAKHQFILSRFLNSLTKHIYDIQAEIQKGFLLFAITLDASKIQGMMFNEKNKNSLSQAFIHLGFPQKSIPYFIQYPQKLIWQDIIQFLLNKEESTVINIIAILIKLKIVNDVGCYLPKLNSIFAQRRILVDLLITKNELEITIENLIIVLENLKLQSTQSIKTCLEKINLVMDKIIYPNSGKRRKRTQLDQLYFEMTANIEKKISINEMCEISKLISQDCFLYNHNLYQCTIASIIASCSEQFIIAIIPTGQGKTWIQALLAKYFCMTNHQVTLVEPNNILQFQSAEKIAPSDFRLTISNVEWFYQYNQKNSIIILNEYDEIITSQPFSIINSQINGVWMLKGRKVVAFSATSNAALERLINNTIQQPKVLKFPSQYEMINGISNLQLGNIISLPSLNLMLQSFQQDVNKFYEVKPLIIIIEQNQEQVIIQFLKQQKFKYLFGASEKNIQEIKQWDYGILVLIKSEVRGVDTKFAQDALVLIIAEVDDDIQYQQFIGRGSRSFGISEGILYTSYLDNTNSIMNKLRKQNFVKYQKLEYMLQFLQKKNNNQKLLEILNKSQRERKQILSLDDLKELAGDKIYQKLIKGITF